MAGRHTGNTVRYGQKTPGVSEKKKESSLKFETKLAHRREKRSWKDAEREVEKDFKDECGRSVHYRKRPRYFNPLICHRPVFRPMNNY